MATDPPLAARRSAPCPDDPTSDLVAQVHNYSRAVIEAELRRLARRARHCVRTTWRSSTRRWTSLWSAYSLPGCAACRSTPHG
jgi:hypothetical protein